MTFEKTSNMPVFLQHYRAPRVQSSQPFGLTHRTSILSVGAFQGELLELPKQMMTQQRQYGMTSGLHERQYGLASGTYEQQYGLASGTLRMIQHRQYEMASETYERQYFLDQNFYSF